MFLDSLNQPETYKFFETLPFWNNDGVVNHPIHVFSHIIGREAQHHWAKTFDETLKIINNPKYEARFYISSEICSPEELESFRRMLSMGIIPMPDDGTSVKLTLGRRGPRWKQCTLRGKALRYCGTTSRALKYAERISKKS